MQAKEKNDLRVCFGNLFLNIPVYETISFQVPSPPTLAVLDNLVIWFCLPLLFHPSLP